MNTLRGINHDIYVLLLLVVGFITFWKSALNFALKDSLVAILGKDHSEESNPGSRIGSNCPNWDALVRGKYEAL